MTNEEIVSAIQAGRRELIPELWERVRRYVEYKARAEYNRTRGRYGITVEDFTQSGFLAMLAAIETYDAQKGTYLNWLDYYLRSEFSHLCGYDKNPDPLNHALSIDAPIDCADDDGVTFADTIVSPEDCYEDTERRVFYEQLHGALEHALELLPDVQAGIIREHYWGGRTLKALSEAHQVSINAIWAREQAALNKIRRSPDAKNLYQFIEDNTDYYRGVSLRQFRNSGDSSVERAVIKREELRTKTKKIGHCNVKQ